MNEATTIAQSASRAFFPLDEQLLLWEKHWSEQVAKQAVWLSGLVPYEEAAEILQSEGLMIEVVDMRFVKPLDEELILEKAKSTGKVITVEEHVLAGGFGSAVLEMFCDRGLTRVAVKRIGIGDNFVEHGPQEQLRQDNGIDAATIAKAGLALHENA